MLSELQTRLPVAVAKSLPPQMIVSLMLDQCRKNPALLECSPNTVLNALYQCASMGLPLDGYHAHLIPFGKDATLIVDWKGYTAIAARYGITAKATLVCEHDEFSIAEDDGAGKTAVTHSWDIRKDRGAVVGVYSRAIRAGHDPDYEFMSMAEVFSIRDRSKAFKGGRGPWITDPGEMARKTVIRRHRKRWPIMSPELAVADEVEGQDFPAIEVVAPKFDAIPEHAETQQAPPGTSVRFAGTTLTDITPSKRGPGRPPKEQPAVPAPQQPVEPEALIHTVQRLCSDAGVPEALLAQYLRQTGAVDESLITLEDIEKVSAETLGTVRDAWNDIQQDGAWIALVNKQEGGGK